MKNLNTSVVKDITIPKDSVLVSLEVSNLFTNIPLKEFIEIVKVKLYNSTLSNIEAEHYIQLNINLTYASSRIS